MQEKPIRIVIEGTDYAGKSAVIKGIDTKIITQNDNNIEIFDGIPNEFKDSNFDKNNATTMERFNYFLKTNTEFSQYMKESSNNIILTRYILNTIAYHNILCSNKSGDYKELEKEVDKNFFFTPNLTILMTTNLEDIKQRMIKRPPKHKYEENAEFLIKAQNELIRLINNPELTCLYGNAIIINNINNNLKNTILQVNNTIKEYVNLSATLQ